MRDLPDVVVLICMTYVVASIATLAIVLMLRALGVL